MAQVILPQSFLKKTMEKAREKKPVNPTDSKNIDSTVVFIDSTTVKNNTSLVDRKFYWLPTVKFMDAFEKENVKFLQNNIISYNDSLSNIALYSEIASDYIGPVRVSAGLTFAYPKSDTNTVAQQKLNRDKFLQKFSTGGGAIALNFILPLFTYNSQIFGITSSTGPRLSLDPPSFGVSGNKFANNVAMGANVQSELRGIKEVFKFTGALRIGYVSGNSAFYDALQFVGGNRKAFWLNNYTIGVNVKDIFTLSYTKFWGSGSIADKLKGYLTFTVSPEFK